MNERGVHLFGFYKDFKDLPQGGSIIAEYVWIDGTGINVRSKARVLKQKIVNLEDIPEWNYDGSSCYQATTLDSEVILKPVAFYPDPFRRSNNILVLCESYVWTDKTFTELKPANSNFRANSKCIFEAAYSEKPWFGIEQEYSLLEKKNQFGVQPLGWPDQGYPEPQGQYYCSVGSNNCFGRAINDAMIKACIYSGLEISGTNAEVKPSQWEYQIGPVEGIKCADQLWISRYILCRIAEDFNVTITFAPKLFKNWNGAGCHTNYSTAKMREGEDCLDQIYAAIQKLSEKHELHIELYGDNSERLSGMYETSSKDKFSFGYGDRSASVRIPTSCVHQKKGYFEDRRPASDMDPYIVTSIIVDTTLIERTLAEPLIEHYRAWKKIRVPHHEV